MDSSTSHDFHQQSNSGLSRFHSAPSSLLVNFMDATEASANKSSFESGRLFTRFMNSGGDSVNNSSFQEYEDKSPISYGNSQQSCSGLPPHYPRQSSAMDSSYELFMDHNTQVKTVNSSLVRQSSSPAGLFAKLSAQNVYASMKDVGKYGGVNGSTGELNPSTDRLKSQLSFPSRIPSSLDMLSQISETKSGSPNHGKVENRNGDARFYSSRFQYGSWNDSSHFTDSITGMKREQENERKLFSGTQNGELGNCVHILSHQLSLPKTSAEMAAAEKFLHFQDSVPCKIRAKRGFATHPRSIAERARRTRISERMRKLQELVPNMDKQTNTADMLDLAVEYIKDLQKQFKTLSDNRAKCKCSSIQKPVPNQIV